MNIFDGRARVRLLIINRLEEGGYLYIAQPPLYKVARGKSEVYLKDQVSLEDFLAEQGIEGATLTLGDGSAMAGPDLARVIEEARQSRTILNAFPTHYSHHQQLSIPREGRILQPHLWKRPSVRLHIHE